MFLGSELKYIDKIWVNSKGVVKGVGKKCDDKRIYFDSKRCKIVNYIYKIWVIQKGREIFLMKKFIWLETL